MKKIYLTFIGLITISSFGQNNKIENTGNVGIGTTTPNQRLHIQSSNSTETYNTYFSGNSIHFDRSGNFSSYLDKTDGGDLVFRFGLPVVDRFYFKNNGNFGIGVNPTEKLDIAGNMKLSGLLRSYGRAVFTNTSDTQVSLYSDDIWAGIDFKDSKGRDFIFYNGTYGTFSIGGDGSNVSGKKLHINGGTTIGTGYRASSVAGNGLAVEGKVGIGTTNPSERLDIEGEGITRMKLKTNSTTDMTGIIFQGARSTGLTSSHFIVTDGPSHYGLKMNADEYLKFQTNGVDRMFIESGGDIGIGTTNPDAKLHITDSGLSSVTSFQINNRFKFRGDGVFSWGANSDYGFLSWDTGKAIIAGRSDNNLSFQTSGTEKMVIKTNGDIGIGTNDTFGYKLAVNGRIGAKEVKVEVSSQWPDYVFTNTYKLPTLKEVEKHIQEKGHLKDIPSAKEVIENKGIELGEMNRKLLQKIEELTLYTIQQEKKIKELEKDRKRLNRLEEKVDLLLKNK
ncbi:hypothetical protein [uncultured Tenacibaculum sp.]|uniref:hypothetical protein n=1 Tax=uncultured Tenacibaculum sp. TaxID=174713 RepID=UPI00260289EB|nr:hypothetical protein [uncultured Tenacibaculum sp.]